MDVCVDILRAVVLDNPVHCGEVNSSRGYVRAEKHRIFPFHKFEVNGRTLSLLLTSMQLEDVDAHLQSFEGLIGETDLLACGEKDYALALLMALEEAEERVQLFLYVHLHVVVEQLDRGDGLQLLCEGSIFRGGLLIVIVGPTFYRVEVVDANVLVGTFKVHSGKVFQLFANRGRE